MRKERAARPEGTKTRPGRRVPAPLRLADDESIASHDSRVLWWQAREFTFTDSAPSPSDQRKTVAEMLNPLLSRLARKEKPATPHVTESRPGIDEQSKGDAETKTVPLKKRDTESKPVAKPKTDKKPKKNAQPRPATEDINPM